MPYNGRKRDTFEARCNAAEDGRYLPKFADLLRCGPYFNGSVKEDAVEFTRLCLSKFRKDYPEHRELEEMLVRIHANPNMVDLRQAVSLIESKSWRYPLSPFGEVVRRRFRHYLASMRDIEQMRWVALECLNRVAGGWIDAATNDCMKAALGWAVHIRYYDHVMHQNCEQMAVDVEGEMRLSYILAFDRLPRAKRR